MVNGNKSVDYYSFFYFVAIIRLLTCIPLEKNANKIAYTYINENGLIKDEHDKDVKKFYNLAMFGQLSMALLILLIVTLLLIV